MLPLSTLLVDDSLPFLDALERLLSNAPEIEVVGRALNGREAVAAVLRLHPDLVLMDWSMPEMNGLEATRQLKEQYKDRSAKIIIIILTQHDIPQYRVAATAAGADGLVVKADMGTQLIPLIEQLVRGLRSRRVSGDYCCIET